MSDNHIAPPVIPPNNCVCAQYERGRELADFVKYLNDKCGTNRLPGGKLSPEVYTVRVI